MLNSSMGSFWQKPYYLLCLALSTCDPQNQTLELSLQLEEPKSSAIVLGPINIKFPRLPSVTCRTLCARESGKVAFAVQPLEYRKTCWKKMDDEWASLQYPLSTNKACLRSNTGTSLVAQWIRIRLPMQGTQVPSLVWEDPTCHGATKPVCHNYWSPHA